MSHLNKKTYKDYKQLIPYINGFLTTLEILNEDVNRGQNYYIEEIERYDNYQESIKKHLSQPNYIITLEEKTDWKMELEQTSIYFFESILNKIELVNRENGSSLVDNIIKRKETNFNFINEEYISLMSELMIDKSKFFEVFVNWNNGSFYECYHKDYLIDNNKGLFFIHFGTSD